MRSLDDSDLFMKKGGTVLFLSIGALVIGSFALTIDSAIIASGRAVVDGRPQVIQHVDGGRVSVISVREGDFVTAGKTLAVLDTSLEAAQLRLAKRSLVESFARMDRLNSEIEGLDAPVFRQEIFDILEDDQAAEDLIDDETSFFNTRKETLQQTLAQLDQRRDQTLLIIEGKKQQLSSSQEQLSLMREELDRIMPLFEKGLSDAQKIASFRREVIQLEGIVGEISASIAEASSSLSGFEIEKLRVSSEFLETAQGELRELQSLETELISRLAIAREKHDRMKIVSPVSGRIMGMKINTVGGVVQPGEELMSIVPDTGDVVFSAEIDPSQIDRVYVNQTAKVRLPNFDAQTTPEVSGSIRSISPDVFSDPSTGRSWYSAEVVLSQSDMESFDETMIMPGMPAEIVVSTGSRSIASYLIKPLADYFNGALREE